MLIWGFISDMCIFELIYLVNKWSLLFQKGTQRRGFAFFQFFLNHFFISRDMTMMYICFLITGTFLTRLSSQIFDLRLQKKFLRAWSSHVDKVLLNTTQNLRIFFRCQSMEWWKSNLTLVFCRRIFFTYRMML